MKTEQLRAIDVHTHAEVSERLGEDPVAEDFHEAALRYFKQSGPRPTAREVAEYYRGNETGPQRRGGRDRRRKP